MAKRWRIHAFDQGRIADLARDAGVPHVVAQLLIARGVHLPQTAREFLAARLSDMRDPAELPGLHEAARHIHQAIRDGRRMTVYGDYDADGITSTAILVRCLQALDASVDYYIPSRLDEGYGLSVSALDQLHAQGTTLVITVDCGIASLAEADHARRLGIELIVTDHHKLADTLPDAVAIVHPELPGKPYAFSGLSGAGVAFKLAWEICRLASGGDNVSDRLRKFLVAAVGLAAMGTIADVVPLVDENRALVRHGLLALKQSPFPGVQALCEITKLSSKREISSEDVAFSLGPRLNAAGRLGQASLGVELLLTEDAARATELARFLDEFNQQRDHLERSILHDARHQIEESGTGDRDAAFVLVGRGWHRGVIGIVAGRLADRYQRPCVLIAFDDLQGETGVGSGRAALGLNLHEALSACREFLVQFGGHAAAAGLRIHWDQIGPFRRAFTQEVDRRIPSSERVSELRIDAEAALPQLTLKTVDQIQQLAPFGQANPRPLLCATSVELEGEPRLMGSGQRHLALRLRQQSISLRAIAFGQAEWASSLAQCEGPIDVAFRPLINEFNGRRNVELHLIDWRPSRPVNTHA